MTIVFAGKSFSGVVNDITNTYYTDPELNGRIGQGEKYIVELKASNVVSTPSATVSLESSNDGVNWVVRNAAVIATIAIPAAGSVNFGIEGGTTTVGGRFARFGIKLTVGGSAYCELWVTARTAV